MTGIYKEISEELFEQAHKNAWTIESMEAHGAEGREVKYIGSRTEGNLIYDYYLDSAGAFWFGRRAIVNEEIVSMEKYIFGHEVRKRHKTRRR